MAEKSKKSKAGALNPAKTTRLEEKIKAARKALLDMRKAAGGGPWEIPSRGSGSPMTRGTSFLN